MAEVDLNSSSMLTDEEFLCVEQLQLLDSNSDGIWNADDDCSPVSKTAEIIIGKVLLNATSCLDIAFRECSERGYLLTLIACFSVLMLLIGILLVFIAKAAWNRARENAESDMKSAGSLGARTIPSDEQSPTRRELSPDSLERGTKSSVVPPGANLYFPSLSRTLEEVRISYEHDESVADGKRSKQDEDGAASDHSPVDIIYDDSGDDDDQSEVSRSKTANGSIRSGSLPAQKWIHQTSAWEEFENSSSNIGNEG